MGPVIVTVILVLVLVLIGLLFAPIDIYLDTRSNNYYAEIKGLVKASVEADKLEILRIRVKVPFRQFYFYPLKPRRKKTGKKPSEKKGRKHWNRFAPKTIWRVLRSFEIKKWELDLDTGDCITNAKLYPLFALLNYRSGGFHVNFEGRNHAVLMVRNRPVSLIKSFFNL
ncbi:hypothetical protein SAMN06265375_1011436 [Muriicola jejuensis]|uniref:DUF2953 domain-containing protein n=1 Tax=Muriicola jejuensis TaxID=504488 RepID=A0A6P0U983_9FLAO|nr:hypothetical protein [Muriicola jejuensis]NER09080.1 hypothetical protein [Muriicola jejuensis]SMP11412.1 hypothetical protein SAMN06265375_1011436 [Muriicola jejuensis]